MIPRGGKGAPPLPQRSDDYLHLATGVLGLSEQAAHRSVLQG
jgi:hypothetical protein